MSDERKRPGEWAAIVEAWPSAAPPRGFADRVLAACEGAPPVRLRVVREPPPSSERASRSALWLAVAVAAVLLALPFALHRRPGAAHAGSVAAAEPSFDLGLDRDSSARDAL